MARIREKIKKGNPYYYLVESRRSGPNNSPREIILEYIGTSKNLMEFATEQYQRVQAIANSAPSFPENVAFKSYAHGAVMGLFWAAHSIGLEKIMDKVFPPKIIKGLPRSRVLLLSMIQRAVEPGSKREFAAWAKTTSLPYHLRFDQVELDSAAFWEAMDGISEEQIEEVWNQIMKQLLERYHITLNRSHLDYSNYFTFINTKNGRCVICKRGHNKQKRDDLLQFSLAALTSVALTVPIVWQVYNGNTNDKAEFPVFTAHIREQMKKLGIDPTEMTISFDGGSNSEENFSGLGFHFVCSHSLTSHKHLYDIDLEQYEDLTLQNGHHRRAYSAGNLTFSGVKGLGVLTFSEDLYNGQMAQLERDRAVIHTLVAEAKDRLRNPRSGFFTSLKKKEKEIYHAQRDAEEYNQQLDAQEQDRIASGQRRRGKKKKYKEIPIWDPASELCDIVSRMIFSKQKYFREFSSIDLIPGENGTYELKWVEDPEKQAAYCRKYYGKKLIVTDHTNWSMLEILNEYADQECIENDIFRMSKNTDHFAVRPQYHWTDDKIRVHLFICMAAIVIAEVLQKHLSKDNIEMTKPAMLDRLNEIRDGWIITGKNKVNRMLEDMDQDHRHLWDSVLKLKEK